MDTDRRLTLIRTAAWLARAAVGLACVIAGTSKIVHPATFIADIWSYHLVPEIWAYWIAAFLPWLEVVIGAALITNRQRAGAPALAATLLLVFLVAIVLSWMRGLDIACGCFGGAPGGETTNYPWLVTRDLLMLAGLGAERILVRVFRIQSLATRGQVPAS
jgi:uncharacterized membrane protein YphA (DoxX/SURF4 family)